jgi:transposase
MRKITRFVGMDVHAETIAVAVAEGREGAARSLGTIANRPEAVRRLLGKLGDPAKLKVCYQAGPTGYALYWQLTGRAFIATWIAPSLVPTKAVSASRPIKSARPRCSSLSPAPRLSAHFWVADRLRA